MLYNYDDGLYEDYFVRTLSEYYDYRYFLKKQFEYAKATIGAK